MLFGWLVLTLILFLSANRLSYLHLFFPEQIGAGRLTLIDSFTFISQTVKATIGIILFSIAAFFCGSLIFKWPEFSVVKSVTAVAIGQISCSVILLTTLSLWSLEKWVTLAILLIGTVSGGLWIGYWIRYRLSLGITFTKRTFLTIKNSAIAILLVAIFLACLAYSSSRLGYDAVAYYFSHARILAITGELILFYPKTAFAVSDLHSSILFSAITQLFGDQAARMLSWVNGGVILLAGWEIGKKAWLSWRARLYSLTLLLTSTAFVDLLGDGKVELISTAPIVLALCWMMDSLQNPSRGQFLLIGALLGFAIIARPYNIFIVPVFTVLFYLIQVFPFFRKEGLMAAWHFARPALWMLPTLLTIGGFHLWQNAFWLGSPFAPFNHAQSLDVDDWHWQFDPTTLNMLRLLYPLTVTFLNTPQSLGNISPLFIGILPFLLLGKVRNQFHLPETLRSLLLPALATLILWITLFFTVVEIRYIFFLWILFFLFGAQVIEAALDTLEKGYQTILRAALALLLVFIIIRTLVISLATYSPVDYNGQAHCYDISFCTFLEPLNQTAAQGERVFVLNAYRYYLRPDLFACSSQAHEYAPMQFWAKENDGAFWAELYRQGFTYLSYEKNFAEFHSHFGAIPPPDSAPEWLRITLISSTRNESVYQLQPTNPPFLPLKTCMQTDNGMWQVTAR